MLYNITLRPIRTRRGAQTGISRFTMEMLVYKQSLLVIGEINISRNSIYLLMVVIG